MMPRGISRVFAMARPRRPEQERLAVLEGANGRGTASQRAARLAADVTALAIEEVDISPDDRVLSLLRDLAPTPARTLATDPTIDTAGLILAERTRRLASRSGRRLPEREWTQEDREIATAVTAVLMRRYRRILGDCCPKPDKRHASKCSQE